MYILFDIGGTKTRISATDTTDSIGEAVSFHTPLGFEDAMTLIETEAKKLAGTHEVTHIVGGIRGPLSADHATITQNDILTDWVNKPIRARLEAIFPGSHATLYNDTAVAALGEAHFGAGRGFGIVAYHTVSTGVGGARVVHGALDTSSVGFEPGHQIIDADVTIREGSGADTLEELISGTAIEKRFGKKPYEILQDDPLWDELARYLSYGLKNTIVYWSPDVIVLGGSMMIGDPRILREDVERHTIATVDGFVPLPAIKDAELGDQGGLFGALATLREGK